MGTAPHDAVVCETGAREEDETRPVSLCEKLVGSIGTHYSVIV